MAGLPAIYVHKTGQRVKNISPIPVCAVKHPQNGGNYVSITYKQQYFFKRNNLPHPFPYFAQVEKAERPFSVYGYVEDGRDCSEILIQIAAVRSAINNIGKIILEDHINHCVVDAVETGDEQVLKDLQDAISKFIK